MLGFICLCFPLLQHSGSCCSIVVEITIHLVFFYSICIFILMISLALEITILHDYIRVAKRQHGETSQGVL